MKLKHSEATLLAMESFMEPVTSDSDLEEGEIEDADNSEIEIISEKLVKASSDRQKKLAMNVQFPLRKRSNWGNEILDIKSKRRKSTCESGPTLPFKAQEPPVMERSQKPQRPGNYIERSPKNYKPRNQPKNFSSRRHADLKIPAKSNFKSPSQGHVTQNQSYEALAISPSMATIKEGTNEKTKISNSPSEGCVKLTDERKELKDIVDNKLAKFSDTQGPKDDPDDEEMMELRLAALQSVVVRTAQTEETSDINPSTQLLVDDEKADDEEDEDEELLRAQLLIEVAKKQTKEMELQARIETLSLAKPTIDLPRQSAVTAAPVIKRKFNPPNQFPKPDRLVINLGDDSSDSSDEDERVEESISALIKSARQSVDQKTSSLPSAVSALPLHEQEEYHRLKSEIERRANRSTATTTSSVRTATFQKPQGGLPNVPSSATLKATAQKYSEDQAKIFATSETTTIAQNPVEGLSKNSSSSTLKEAAQKLVTGSSKAVANSLTPAVSPKSQDGLQKVAPTMLAVPMASPNPQEEPSKIVLSDSVTATLAPPLEGVLGPLQEKEPSDVQDLTTDRLEPDEFKSGMIEESKSGATSVDAESQIAKLPEVVIAESAFQTKVPSSSTSDSLLKPAILANTGSSSPEKLKANAQNVHAKKVAALKQQLLQKKMATKDALKSQLELVDKNRALLERSSQEVARLKAMLQTAEEGERQFRSQLNSSQSQLQHLNKKMLLLEEEISALHKSGSPLRTKRLNQKLRAKSVHTAMSVMNSSQHASPLRAKPVVLAKALSNKAVVVNYSSSGTRSSNGSQADLSNALKSASVRENCVKKNAGKYDDWLYGTLGDDTPESISCFPAWSSNEHASKRVGEPRLNPWKILCLNNLGAQCEKNCTFQHLREEDIAAVVRYK